MIRYVIEAHGKYRGEVINESLGFTLLGVDRVMGWVDSLQAAHLFTREEAFREERRHGPCAERHRVYLHRSMKLTTNGVP